MIIQAKEPKSGAACCFETNIALRFVQTIYLADSLRNFAQKVIGDFCAYFVARRKKKHEQQALGVEEQPRLSYLRKDCMKSLCKKVNNTISISSFVNKFDLLLRVQD